jgi:hypothetical protein
MAKSDEIFKGPASEITVKFADIEASNVRDRSIFNKESLHSGNQNTHVKDILRLHSIVEE